MRRILNVLAVSLCISFILCPLSFAQQAKPKETLVIETYYPSPYGAYDELTAAKRQAIGNVNADIDGKVDENDMAVYPAGHLQSGQPIPGSLTVAGNVGIWTTDPFPGYTLTVNGTAWCTSGLWTGSDLRWKENIQSLDVSLAKLLRLRGIKYDWKRSEFKDYSFPEGRQIGIIAQEMEQEFPELVTTDGQGYKAIAYDRFTAVLLEGNQGPAAGNRGFKAGSQQIKVGLTIRA